MTSRYVTWPLQKGGTQCRAKLMIFHFSGIFGQTIFDQNTFFSWRVILDFYCPLSVKLILYKIFRYYSSISTWNRKQDANGNNKNPKIAENASGKCTPARFSSCLCLWLPLPFSDVWIPFPRGYTWTYKGFLEISCNWVSVTGYQNIKSDTCNWPPNTFSLSLSLSISLSLSLSPPFLSLSIWLPSISVSCALHLLYSSSSILVESFNSRRLYNFSTSSVTRYLCAASSNAPLV